MSNNIPKPVIVRRNVKHTFSVPEIAELNTQFRLAYQTLKATEAEFDSVKAVWKSKVTEAESRMETLSATLNAGFESRQKDCEVRFRPLDKKKDFWCKMYPDTDPVIVATEDMTPDDFALDLLWAESAFSQKVEIELWAAGNDHGKLIVGQQMDRWFSAIRAQIGQSVMDERLDSEQRSYVNRFNAIERAGMRCVEWVKETMGKEPAKGILKLIEPKIEAERGKVE